MHIMENISVTLLLVRGCLGATIFIIRKENYLIARIVKAPMMYLYDMLC